MPTLSALRQALLNETAQHFRTRMFARAIGLARREFNVVTLLSRTSQRSRTDAPSSWGQSLIRGVRRNASGLLFLLPALILFSFFVWYPIVYGFVLSFQDNSLFGGSGSWVGWLNFQRVIADPLFSVAWANTAKYVLYGLLFGYALPVLLAIAVNEVRHGKAYFRLAFYLPVIIPPLVTVFLWRYMYTPDGGLLNGLLGVGRHWSPDVVAVT